MNCVCVLGCMVMECAKVELDIGGNSAGKLSKLEGKIAQRKPEAEG